MLYNKIIKILDVSQENNVDISVAKDILIAENPLSIEDIMDTYKILDLYYKPITAFIREDRLDLIKEVCILVENNDTQGIKNFMITHEDFIEQSFKKAQSNN